MSVIKYFLPLVYWFFCYIASFLYHNIKLYYICTWHRIFFPSYVHYRFLLCLPYVLAQNSTTFTSDTKKFLPIVHPLLAGSAFDPYYQIKCGLLPVIKSKYQGSTMCMCNDRGSLKINSFFFFTNIAKKQGLYTFFAAFYLLSDVTYILTFQCVLCPLFIFLYCTPIIRTWQYYFWAR